MTVSRQQKFSKGKSRKYKRNRKYGNNFLMLKKRKVIGSFYGLKSKPGYCPPFFVFTANCSKETLSREMENTVHLISYAQVARYTYLFTMLCLPFWSLKSSLLFSAASFCPFSAETEALPFLFSTTSGSKNDHTPWYHHI